MQEQEPNKKKKKSVLLGITLLAVITILGISYAVLTLTLTGNKKYSIKIGDLLLNLDESRTSENIFIENAVPTTDEEGMRNAPYNFSLLNGGTDDLEYTIYLVEEELANKTPSSAIRYYYSRDIGNIEVIRNLEEQKTEDGRFYLETGTIPAKTTYNYTFKMWLNYNAGNEIVNTEYSVHLEVLASQIPPDYTEEILHGTDPVLSDNLVPVMIANDGTVTRAGAKDEWYDYANKKWANAVVLEDSAQTYKEGDIINLDDIESYFVWIPRYKYKIFNDGNYTGSAELNAEAPQTIEIEFESKSAALSNGTVKDEWLSHPAFQAFDTNGFWVGKFQSGYRGATSESAAQVSTADSTKLIVRPNLYSWRGITLGNMFKTSYEYLRDNESHMMKNTEWGAVAYLSHSQYGANKEVYINNNSSLLTGCGGDTADASESSSCLNAYGSKVDGIYNQSTTGNISGIFDMSGGGMEYVMGYNTSGTAISADWSEIKNIYSDFFDNHQWDRYYDKYENPSNTSNSDKAYNNRILGDATGEMGPFDLYHSSWYNDEATFVSFNSLWFYRGSIYREESSAGIFSFGATIGCSGVYGTFRVVLSVTG